MRGLLGYGQIKAGLNMKQIPLGDTGMMVSEYCLGTMTWGSQNTQDQAHEQMDYALAQGVNFWDTAEMYPTTPISKDTVGLSESIVGSWLSRNPREKVILATKITGEGQALVREGQVIDGKTLRQSVEGSLKRLKTDYIDLYQLHWPNRGSYHFRKIWAFTPQTNCSEVEDNMCKVLTAANELISEGKIRALGLSNESVWGTAKWLSLAKELGLPRMASVQNEYSLLCRQFDSDWAELSAMENIPLLAFSPLACGLLTGKYAQGSVPQGSRLAIGPAFGGRMTPQVFQVVDAYLDLAKRHGLAPNQMSLAFCRSRPYPNIPIFGATTREQLASNIAAADITLSPELLTEITAMYSSLPPAY
ncbi:MAG: aryl-alcohol dehydrogenase-like predicted oxidoreductase [Paracoccaceae bacterium]